MFVNISENDVLIGASSSGPITVLALQKALYILSFSEQRVQVIPYNDVIADVLVQRININGKSAESRYLVVVAIQNGRLDFLSETGRLLTSKVLSSHYLKRFSLVSKGEGELNEILISTSSFSLLSFKAHHFLQFAEDLLSEETTYSLPYTTFKVNHESIEDVMVLSVERASPFDQMYRLSYDEDSNHSNADYYVTVGGPPSFLQYNQMQNEYSTSIISDSLTLVASNLLSSVKSRFFKGWTTTTTPEGEKVEEKPEVKQLYIRLSQKDPSKKIIRILPSPNQKYSLLLDAQKRVFLLDNDRKILLHIWKGYHDVQGSWILLERGDSLIALYVPRRKIIEIWSPEKKIKIADFPIPFPGAFVSLNSTVLRVPFSSPSPLYSRPTKNSFFLNFQTGEKFHFVIPLSFLQNTPHPPFNSVSPSPLSESLNKEIKETFESQESYKCFQEHVADEGFLIYLSSFSLEGNKERLLIFEKILLTFLVVEKQLKESVVEEKFSSSSFERNLMKIFDISLEPFISFSSSSSSNPSESFPSSHLNLIDFLSLFKINEGKNLVIDFERGSHKILFYLLFSSCLLLDKEMETCIQINSLELFFKVCSSSLLSVFEVNALLPYIRRFCTLIKETDEETEKWSKFFIETPVSELRLLLLRIFDTISPSEELRRIIKALSSFYQLRHSFENEYGLLEEKQRNISFHQVFMGRKGSLTQMIVEWILEHFPSSSFSPLSSTLRTSYFFSSSQKLFPCSLDKRLVFGVHGVISALALWKRQSEKIEFLETTRTLLSQFPSARVSIFLWHSFFESEFSSLFKSLQREKNKLTNTLPIEFFECAIHVMRVTCEETEDSFLDELSYDDIDGKDTPGLLLNIQKINVFDFGISKEFELSLAHYFMSFFKNEDFPSLSHVVVVTSYDTARESFLKIISRCIVDKCLYHTVHVPYPMLSQDFEPLLKKYTELSRLWNKDKESKEFLMVSYFEVCADENGSTLLSSLDSVNLRPLLSILYSRLNRHADLSLDLELRLSTLENFEKIKKLKENKRLCVMSLKDTLDFALLLLSNSVNDFETNELIEIVALIKSVIHKSES